MQVTTVGNMAITIGWLIAVVVLIIAILGLVGVVPDSQTVVFGLIAALAVARLIEKPRRAGVPRPAARSTGCRRGGPADVWPGPARLGADGPGHDRRRTLAGWRRPARLSFPLH